MASHVFLDASALAKRYLVELGTANVNHLFRVVASSNLACLTLATLETISVLVRARNRGTLTQPDYQQAVSGLRADIIQNPAVVKITGNDAQITAAGNWIEKHSVNATDALVLEVSMAYHRQLTAIGHSLALFSADLRLVKAAQAEGLATFNPETQTQAELDSLLKT